jgi:hypothetical protein
MNAYGRAEKNREVCRKTSHSDGKFSVLLLLLLLLLLLVVVVVV